MAIGDANVTLGLDPGRLVRGLRAARAKFMGAIRRMQADAETGGESLMSRMAKGIKKNKKKIIGAFVAIGAAIALTIREFVKDESEFLRLEKALNASGKAAGFNARELRKFAQELQDVTIIDDTKILEAMSLIATFTNITGKNFKEATRAALDLAVATKTDVKSAALQLGKALSSPVDGLTALRRSGIVFTNQQKEMIVTMFKAGQVAEAQVKIFAILRANAIDANAEASENFADQLKLTLNVLSDIIVEVGRFITELFGLERNATTLSQTMKALRGDINKAFRGEAALRFKETIQTIGFAFQALFAFAKAAASGIISGFKAAGIIIGGLSLIIFGVAKFLVSVLGDAILFVVTQFKIMFESLGDGAKSALALLKGNFKEAAKFAKKATLGAAKATKENFKKGFEGIKTSAKDAGKFIKQGVKLGVFAGKKAFKEWADQGDRLNKTLDNIGKGSTTIAAKAKKAAKKTNDGDEKRTDNQDAWLKSFRLGIDARRDALADAKGELEVSKEALKAEQKKVETRKSISFIGIAELFKQASNSATAAFNKGREDLKKAEVERLREEVKSAKEKVKARKEDIKQFIQAGKERAAPPPKPGVAKTARKKLEEILKQTEKGRQFFPEELGVREAIDKQTVIQKQEFEIQKKMLEAQEGTAKQLKRMADAPLVGVFGTSTG